jgi:hypothetical protein
MHQVLRKERFFPKRTATVPFFRVGRYPRSLKETKEIDLKMPVVNLGEAMTYNHGLWSEQDFEYATLGLAKLKSFSYQSNCNSIEEDLIPAVHLLYTPKMDKPSQDITYS